MTSELEAVGALATATLVAGTIEGAAQPASADTPAHASCANCGAALAGAYCSACGQKAHIHRSLLHLVEEFLHGLLHFDAKAWRTLPLLVARPGLLTRRYIDGQRTRYVSPLALFLFTIFLMFFVFSFSVRPPPTPATMSEAQRGQARAELQGAINEARQEVAEQQRELDKALKEGVDVKAAQADLTHAQRTQEIAEKALAAFNLAAQNPAAAASAAAGTAELALGMNKLRINTERPGLNTKLKKQLQNSDLLIYKLKNAAYKFSFLLIPISLPFLWLMFIGRRGVTMFDHAVFSLYSLSFMAALFSVVALLSLTPLETTLVALVLLVPPVHMFAQLRGTYGLTIPAALWRTVLLLFVVGLAFLLFLLFIVAVSVS
jgi:hypothetical protein